MNFKNIIFIFIILNLTGCGVKAKPAFPPDTAIKTYLEKYTGKDLDNKEAK